MNGYICMYKKEKVEIYTDKGQYEAQQLAAIKLGVAKSRQRDISVYLCEKDGVPVVQSTCF